MAQKSRLGKGLGALFPVLPGEEVRTVEKEGKGQEKQDEAKLTSRVQNKSNGSAETSRKRGAGKAAGKGRGKKQIVSRETSDGLKADVSEKRTKNSRTDSDNETKAARTTGGHDARSVRRKHGQDVSRETSEVALSNSETRSLEEKNVSRETSARSMKHRKTMPKFDEIAHPSDVFFGGVLSSGASMASAARNRAVEGAESERTGALSARASQPTKGADSSRRHVSGEWNTDDKSTEQGIYSDAVDTQNQYDDVTIVGTDSSTYLHNLVKRSTGDKNAEPQSIVSKGTSTYDEANRSGRAAYKKVAGADGPVVGKDSNDTGRSVGNPTNPTDRQSRRKSESVSGKKQVEEGLKPVSGGYLAELRLDQIGPNVHQPRSIFDEDELKELAASLKEVGVLQPVVVRKRPSGQHPVDGALATVSNNTKRPQTGFDSEYELIMGERRWRASALAGLKSIPAIVRTTSDDEMLRDALLENLHRVALNPLEEAAAYQQMMDDFGLTQAKLSQSISKSRSQIANTLRLLNLPPSVQKKVAAGVLSAGHARALLGLSSREEMDKLANRIIAEGLSVRSTEEVVAMKTLGGDKQRKKDDKKRTNPWNGSQIQQSLENHFDTKVSIKGNKKHGRIEIVFSSPEDMDRIMNLLVPAQGESHTSDWV